LFSPLNEENDFMPFAARRKKSAGTIRSRLVNKKNQMDFKNIGE